MKKKNGFVKPTELEAEIQQTFSSVVSSIPSSPTKVKAVLGDIKGMGKSLKAKRKAGIKRLIKK